jgi:hypothetical protein
LRKIGKKKKQSKEEVKLGNMAQKKNPVRRGKEEYKEEEKKENKK